MYSITQEEKLVNRNSTKKCTILERGTKRISIEKQKIEFTKLKETPLNQKSSFAFRD